MKAPTGIRLVPSPISGFVPPVEHRFKPGQSGNPGGKIKTLSRAIEKRLNREAEAIVGALIEKAKAGDVRAIELLLERTEGAVQKEMNHTGAVGVVKILLRKDVHG